MLVIVVTMVIIDTENNAESQRQYLRPAKEV